MYTLAFSQLGDASNSLSPPCKATLNKTEGRQAGAKMKNDIKVMLPYAFPFSLKNTIWQKCWQI